MMILRLCRSEYILRVKFVKRRTIKLNQEQIQFSCDVIPVLFEFHVRPAEVTFAAIAGYQTHLLRPYLNMNC